MGSTASNWTVGGNLSVTGTSSLTGNATVTGDLSAANGPRHQVGPWYQADCTASQSTVQLTLSGAADADITEMVIPFAGSVVGISIACEAARTAGTATVDVTLNGTATGLQAVLGSTDAQYAYAVQAKDTDAITAGQRLGVEITTTASWAAATTPSIVVGVWIE